MEAAAAWFIQASATMRGGPAINGQVLEKYRRVEDV